MDDKLLVRVYNVGLGDCIYVRVPDGGGTKHLLIDCGNKYGTDEDLKTAIKNLKEVLPKVEGTNLRRLDLLVVTHAHEDHVRGFDVDLFAGIRIDRLWMSVAMNREHPQAENAHALQAFALETLQRLQLSPKAGMADWAASMLALSKDDGMDALLDTLPVGSLRRYIHTETPAQELALFDDPNVQLQVLAPMNDIDHFYLGRETAAALKGFKALNKAVGTAGDLARDPQPAVMAEPANVSREDFERLRRSLTDQALAFVLKAGELVNNTSVVLLLEWRGRRLLFTGDAEVKTAFKGEFQEEKGNGSWNVMWHKFKEGALSQPVDFLKVGHHGSHNATPWTGKKVAGAEHPINAILDSLLPVRVEGAPERYALVSTERTHGYPTIPDPALMMELGKRVSNADVYQESTELGHFVPADQRQPQRTDLERADGERVPWIDIELAPLP
ncbi:MAG: hypothetical protein QOH06_3969 [Acidobacteriota bacterium]|jgi:beta-lactamase superfamily II metal-dependent hydrolase|nr:hypothetical protein [Acidobacteriota bacterium]